MIIGVLLGLGVALSGIVVIQYTEAFFLVVILWVALPVMIIQTARWFKEKLRRE